MNLSDADMKHCITSEFIAACRRGIFLELKAQELLNEHQIAQLLEYPKETVSL